MGSANTKTPFLQDRRWGFFVLVGKDRTRPHSLCPLCPCGVAENCRVMMRFAQGLPAKLMAGKPAFGLSAVVR
jgi:hypothetical protein